MNQDKFDDILRYTDGSKPDKDGKCEFYLSDEHSEDGILEVYTGFDHYLSWERDGHRIDTIRMKDLTENQEEIILKKYGEDPFSAGHDWKFWLERLSRAYWQ